MTLQDYDGGVSEDVTITVNAAQFEQRLGRLANILDTVRLRVDSDGLHLRGNDVANVVLAETTIPVETAEPIPEPFERDLELQVGVEDLSHFLSPEDRTLDIRYDYQEEALLMSPENSEGFLMETSEASKIVSDPPGHVASDFTAYATVDSPQLVGLFKGLSHSVGTNSSVVVGVTSEGFGAGRSVSNKEWADEWYAPKSAVHKLDSDEDTYLKLSSSYLSDLADALPRSWKVELSLGDEIPIRLEVTSNWTYWLAPRIQESGPDV